MFVLNTMLDKLFPTLFKIICLLQILLYQNENNLLIKNW